MRFNKAISPIKAISFDLDDTLYDNRPVIIAAVAAMNNHLLKHPAWQSQGEAFWSFCRNTVATQQPNLCEDVTKWRQHALLFGFQQLGFDDRQSQQFAKEAYQAFAEARSHIVVTDDVIALLGKLRQRYKLVALTNGNVEVEKFNLAGQFDLVLKAGIDGRAKPHPEMYHRACQQLQLAPEQLLHVGDSLDTDVQGAHRAGCASVWLRNNFTRYSYLGLAHIEIDSILELNALLP
ncbi:HAD-IA family hydrolase [Pseudoalteromonas sp. T1lg65]|uniref:HAD-IA family hydrolase n=1 Tax=Pseudoalteromonas sp. T1lg65 TaxID=2077101 RepID=UPI003F791D71